MITYPNCKINLGLHVVGRRPDGYHDLETLFLPVHDMCDELEITTIDTLLSQPQAVACSPDLGEQPECTLTVQGIALDGNPDDNLCMRAYRLLHDEFAIPAVHIRLKKNIPFGAGLGGGSSDAAFTLKMLNSMFSLGLSDADLERRAARLGADCAFFIRNQPAYATGIGDVLEPIEFPILNSLFSIQIEIPEGEHVSTKEAYAGLKLDPTHSSVSLTADSSPNLGELPDSTDRVSSSSPKLGEQPDSTDRVSSSSPKLGEVAARSADGGVCQPRRPDLRQAIKEPIEHWRHLIVNDFEASVFPAHPAIAALKDDMYRRGALYASMTGSGAAVFGIFRK
ncbi:MAG: 4-(cytidine 5'-diphospho)-2-C-methyl-D-erythritol kinase [Bacteroidales bacterium]|nr:4-(cytidine 5'-diphospho)-2-C-methyl-D-erythritol kinase [Bacteroidales bacterium]